MADNFSALHMPFYLLQCVFIILPDLETTTVVTFVQKNTPCENSNKTCAWAADNFASVGRLFLSVIK